MDGSSYHQYEFTCYKCMWFNYMLELNWDPTATNPLERVAEVYSSVWPEVIALLEDAHFIGMPQDYYLQESDKYCDYLGKGGKPFSDKTH